MKWGTQWGNKSELSVHYCGVSDAIFYVVMKSVQNLGK